MSYFDFSNFESSFNNYTKYILGKQPEYASKNDQLNAVSYAVGKYLTDISYDTQKRYQDNDVKRLHYLSLEFLIGRLLSNNLLNLGIYNRCKRFLEKRALTLIFWWRKNGTRLWATAASGVWPHVSLIRWPA